MVPDTFVCPLFSFGSAFLRRKRCIAATGHVLHAVLRRKCRARRNGVAAPRSFACAAAWPAYLSMGSTMNAANDTFHAALSKLLREVFDGPPGDEAYILNPGDAGLLRQLDGLDADGASSRPMPGRTTIASHTNHVLYGLSLLNRWAAGEANPWAGTDWDAAWKTTTVTADAWRSLRDALRREAANWQRALAARTEWDDVSAAGAISSVAHTAYHLGAIRQILAAQDKRA